MAGPATPTIAGGRDSDEGLSPRQLPSPRRPQTPRSPRFADDVDAQISSSDRSRPNPNLRKVSTLALPPSRFFEGLSPATSSRRGSAKRDFSDFFQSRHRLLSPLWMVALFTGGLGLATAHMAFYHSLRGRILPGAWEQENNIRLGTVLGTFSQFALAGAVWIAYAQWMWREIRRLAEGREKGERRGELGLGFLDKIWGIDMNFGAFFNREIWTRFRIGSSLALIAWLMMIPPFITVSSLFVYSSFHETQELSEVRFPGICVASDYELAVQYAYSPPVRGDTPQNRNDTSRRLVGPRTVITLITAAAASSGRILSIAPPANQSSYQLHFYGPIIRCEDADEERQGLIDGLLADKNQSDARPGVVTEYSYYGFVPGTDENGILRALDERRFQQPSLQTPSNEIWMTYLRFYLDEDGGRHIKRDYTVCTLWNATYDIRLTFDNGHQIVSPRADDSDAYQVLHQIDFPNDQPGQASDMAQHSASSLFWALADQIVGSLSWSVDTNCDPDQEVVPCQRAYGIIHTMMQSNSLLGTSSLDVFFEYNENTFRDPHSDIIHKGQRLADKLLAKNATLGDAIEELSFNATVSLLQNDLLTLPVNRTVSSIRPVNRYDYSQEALFIPYVLALVLALAACVTGGISFYREGLWYLSKDLKSLVMAFSGHKDPKAKLVVSVSFEEGKPIFEAITRGDSYGEGDGIMRRALSRVEEWLRVRFAAGLEAWEKGDMEMNRDGSEERTEMKRAPPEAQNHDGTEERPG